MENNPPLQFSNWGFVLIIGLLIYSPFFVGELTAQAKHSSSKTSKQRQIITTECLEDKPKPHVMREFGVVNKSARLMPKSNLTRWVQMLTGELAKNPEK